MRVESEQFNDDVLRQAHKVNKLVDEGLVSPEEASQAEADEIDAMIAKMFDKKFSQNYYKPWEIKEKTMGQKAEDLLVEILKHLPFFSVRHGTDQEDAARKTDIILHLEGRNRDIPVQLATYTDPDKLMAKRKKLPHEVVLVAVPMGEIFRAYEKHDEQAFRSVIERFMRQLLYRLKHLPEYFPVYQDLQAQLAEVVI